MRHLRLWEHPTTMAEKVRNSIIGTLVYFVAGVASSILFMHRIAWTGIFVGMVVFFVVYLLVVKRK